MLFIARPIILLKAIVASRREWATADEVGIRRRLVIERREPELPQPIRTIASTRRLNSRKQHGRENADGRNDHEQLDQGKTR